MKKIITIIVVVFIAFNSHLSAQEKSANVEICNDTLWYDTEGNEIWSNGGNIIKEVVIENDQLMVAINPVGAELMRIHHKVCREFLWQGEPDYWASRAPVMFPVNVRFKDERFVYEGKEYEMPRMGLAINARFKLLCSDSPDEAVLVLKSTPEILKNNYPFPFRLLVKYSVKRNRLINEFEVINEGKDTMYFAFGGHPGIDVPLKGNANRKDYQISFFEPVEVKRNLIDSSLFHDSLIPFLEGESYLNLDDERIPDGGMFIENSNIRRFGIGKKGQPPYAIIHLGNFPNVNIWTPPGMPFVCIEPMVSHHDRVDANYDIKKKEHLIALPPGKSKKYSFTIEILAD